VQVLLGFAFVLILASEALRGRLLAISLTPWRAPLAVAGQTR
jgi:hypothetical protein